MAKQTWYIIIGICLLLFIIGLIIPGDSETSNEPDESDKLQLNEFGEEYEIEITGACVMAQMFIEDKLKSPSSAKFQWCHDANIVYLGNQTYEVYSYVDSQNSFGAMIRTDYWIRIIDKGEDLWSMEDFYLL